LNITGSGLFADGPQPSAKSGLPSAKALPMAIRRGRRQRAIGRHFFGKGRFADGQLSGHRQSFADGHISNRQRRHVSRRAVRLTAALPTADAARPSAKRFYFFSEFLWRRPRSSANYFCRRPAIGKVMVILPTAWEAVGKPGIC